MPQTILLADQKKGSLHHWKTLTVSELPASHTALATTKPDSSVESRLGL